MARHWPRLGAVASGRDNNLNLIRMAAALAVLVSHAWPIALGPGAVQPLEALTGFQLGTQAVYVFFAISGFLIARSYERHASVRGWALARALRIYPGLAVALVLTALALGPLVTTLPLRDYLASAETWTYVPAGLSLAWRQTDLPGVFEGLPFLPETNGSLWTLQYEVMCYLAVLVLGLVGAFRSPRALVAAVAVLGLADLLMAAAPDRLPVPLRSLLALGLPFAVGVAFHLGRRRLPLNPWLLLPLAVLALAARGTPFHQPLYVLALSYGTFLLAYLPGGRVRGYNAVGDYSYGVYIYAWPVQQAVMEAAGPIGPGLNVAFSLPFVLVLAWLSWTFVEKPALALLRPASGPRRSASAGLAAARVLPPDATGAAPVARNGP